MSGRQRMFDDLAGVAGGALSALMGLRDEAEAVARGRIDAAIRRLDLVRRDELDAALTLAANARAGQEAAEAPGGLFEPAWPRLKRRLQAAAVRG